MNDMKTNYLHTKKDQSGIALLVTLLLMSVLLGISASLLNITLKQYQLSGIALASEMAFQAANAGMECALYNDLPKTGTSPFDVNGDGTSRAAIQTAPGLGCMGVTSGDLASIIDNSVVSGEEQLFRFTWGSPQVCSEVSMYKYYSTTGPVNFSVNGTNKTCDQGSVCTVVQARGYNVSCAEVSTGGRVVEREYTQVY